MDSRSFRLIIDPPRDATLNMAIDEVLMETQKEPDSAAVLRFYDWQRPSMTIGYFQSVRKVAEKYRCHEKRIPVVRRLTGGGVVHHGKDVTMSLCLKNPNGYLPQSAKESYRTVNQAVRLGLERLLPAIAFQPSETLPLGRAQLERDCFQSPSACDLMTSDRKIVGAAQRRKDGTLLHQSSILVDCPKADLIELICKGFEHSWGIVLTESALTAYELGLAQTKEKLRYRLAEWSYSV